MESVQALIGVSFCLSSFDHLSIEPESPGEAQLIIFQLFFGGQLIKSDWGHNESWPAFQTLDENRLVLFPEAGERKLELKLGEKGGTINKISQEI